MGDHKGGKGHVLVTFSEVDLVSINIFRGNWIFSLNIVHTCVALISNPFTVYLNAIAYVYMVHIADQ